MEQNKELQHTGVQGLRSLTQQPGIQKKLQEVLGTPQKASKFCSALITIANGNAQLKQADPQSIMGAAMVAATLGLDIVPTLGLAYVIPYGRQAQFQIGYRGLVQLMQNTGKMRRIVTATVYEGELVRGNRFTEEYEFDETCRQSDTVIGYMAMFETTGGFRKTAYWTKAQVEQHARRYSQAFQRGVQSSPWVSNFDQMAQKTVLKSICKWAPQSTEMQLAQQYDQAVVNTDGAQFDGEEVDLDALTPEYVDNPTAVTHEQRAKSKLNQLAEETATKE